MDIMTVDEINRKKKEYGYSYEDLADMSGVPVSTVQKVLGKITANPRRSTLEALSSVFMSGMVQEETGHYHCTDNISFNQYGMTDGSSAYDISSNHNHTIEDYLALPDDIRVELIDGVFYYMATPTVIHQRIASLIFFALENFVDSNGGSCIPMIAPADVQLDCDDKTMVEPDVFVLCDRDKITKPRVVGAPDLVIEVLSPSNWFHDTIRKLRKYRNAGVREYWIVMPDSLKVLVYNFKKSVDPEEYTFADKIPVSIWDGKCNVDFKKIYDKISFML